MPNTPPPNNQLDAWLHHIENTPALSAPQLRVILAITRNQLTGQPARIAAETIARTAAITEDTAAQAIRRLIRRDLIHLNRAPDGHLHHQPHRPGQERQR